ncbi:MAG: amidohydrolase [Desulfobacteraceae bacterium]|nr:amidohydrolase [Desulfobacteraceae bacterium]
MNILKLAADQRQMMVRLRRQFHMYPETGWNEHETSAAVQAALERLDIPFTTVAQTGVIAVIEGGQPGGTVALRADMDALPLQEKNGHDYVSRNPGVCHACGHDAHMAMLLGAAAVLVDIRDQIKGRVKLVFQPAEEIFGGAGAIIDAGGINGTDGIFGLHIIGNLPAGQAAVSPGPVMAAANHFTVDVTGRSGHGGRPHEGVDALLAGSPIIMNLQSVASREINPLDTVVVSVGRLSAGTAYNIIAGSALLEGTTRCFSEHVNEVLPGRMERVIKNTAQAYGAGADLDYTPSVPPTVNDLSCTRLAEKTIDQVCGSGNRGRQQPVTGAEDFALYLRQVPGVFVFLGGGNKEKGLVFPQHHESFDIAEEALSVGAALHARYAVDFLNTFEKK